MIYSVHSIFLFIFLDALNPVTTDDDIVAERLEGIGEAHKDPCLEVL